MTTRNVAIFLPPNMTFYREMISGALDYAGLHSEIVIHHNPERELSELEISGKKSAR